MKLPTHPLVSVIMPAFNAKATIIEAVDSILNQTLTDLELIICDDGSTDHTVDLLSGIDDTRLRIICNKVNLGPGASRDIAILESSGKWIAFVDADDAWIPERLEKMLAAASPFEDVVVFDDIMECRSSRGKLVPIRRLRGSNAFGSRETSLSISAAQLIRTARMLMQPMFSRQTVEMTGAMHSNYSFGEDTHFLLMLLAGGAKLVYVPQAMYMYRISETSASSNPMKYAMLLEILDARLQDFHRQPETQKALREKISRLRLQEARFRFTQALKGGEFAGALRVFLRKPMLLAELMRHHSRLAMRKLLPRYR